jgi:hypothetical protein
MFVPNRTSALAAGLALVAMLSGVATAASVEMQAAKDNTLYIDTEGFVSGALIDGIFAGVNAGGQARRGLLEFDVAGALPAGATITSVRLVLQMSRTVSGAIDVGIHPVAAEWGEGTSVAEFGNGGGGAGGQSTTGDATWLHTFFPSTFWSDPGGDFSLGASATISVSGIASYTWGSTAEMVADVQGWLDDPSSNHGWLVLGDETTTATAKKFNSRENGNPSSRPKLIVEYEPATDADLPPGAGRLALSPARPNPFNPRTALDYTLPSEGPVRITLHDARGRLVATLVDGVRSAGTHMTVWSGRDAHGRDAASGVYVVRLQSGSETRSRTIVLAK